MVDRREFLKSSMAALGFLTLPGGLFAAPKGWKPSRKKPNLVFGVLSDTHLMVEWDRKSVYRTMTLDYIRNAFKLFKESGIDAFVHLGDASHRGDIREWEFHRETYDEVFGKNGPPMIVVVGNHELFQFDKKRFPDEWESRMLSVDLARHYENVWGEPYTEVLHKEVNGYHFFGNHWGVDDEHAGVKMAQYINEHAEEFALKGDKPFFILSHKMTYFPCNMKLKAFPNAIGFCGHWHTSLANWQSIYYERNYKLFPYINCGACRYDGENGLSHDGLMEKPDPLRDEETHEFEYPSRQAMVVKVYDDMVVFERHEVNKGGKLGPDWVFPVGNFETRPYSRETLEAKIGCPEFRARAKLEVKKQDDTLSIAIPMADGNPKSRVFAYDVAVTGKDPEKRYFKSVYFAAVGSGIGHEEDGGVTHVDIPVSELPQGERLTIGVRPLSSLGTKGKVVVSRFVMGGKCRS